MASSLTRDDQFLFGNRRCWFLNNLGDVVDVADLRKWRTTNRSVVEHFVLTCRLNRGDRAFVFLCNFNQLRRTALIGAADVKVIGDEMQKRFTLKEFRRAKNRIAVAARVVLFAENESRAMRAGGGQVRFRLSRADDDRDFFDSGFEDLVQRVAGG